ncbi:S8 family serine peptidase [Amycolatopsis sp. NPDC051061]|uniref:S53 family peptidase n=1 Tax=Amycolatopsis sp. NPDC051061 TaxID=3155042 RepID=UPI00344A057C
MLYARTTAAAIGLFAAFAVAPAATAATQSHQACPEPAPGFARCLTTYESTPSARSAAVEGVGADDLAAAYHLPATAGAQTVVGISIAYDAPNLEADLNEYRRQYGLPECTAATGCFRKVNQKGEAGPVPTKNLGWSVESTLDVSMVSAACPTCKILVVEGNSPGYADLAETEDTAVRLGATVVSNSYGGRENGLALDFESSYVRDDATIVASSGDTGFTAASFPAVFGSVVSVGGTTLVRDESTPRGWSESAWRFGGSGCSAYIAKPAWQPGTNCAYRTTADISAAAEDIALYNTDRGGWFTVGGTSASAPFIAGLYGRTGGKPAPGSLYRNADALFDITTGANDGSGTGAKCGGDYLCKAQPGYDAPTGLGTPNGLAAFE